MGKSLETEKLKNEYTECMKLFSAISNVVISSWIVVFIKVAESSTCAPNVTTLPLTL